VTAIKVIDLFAGPGGLGEGFTAFRDAAGKQRFKIALSIEKEASAHRTLTLRSFFRQYPDASAPEAYYAFMRGELGTCPEDTLYRLPELRSAYEAASREAAQFELGQKGRHASIYKAIRDSLNGDEWVLLGGPPCQAYSLVGRARNYGGAKNYDADTDHRNFLYLEYLRIIAKFQPMAFVMENVKGLLSAKTAAGPVFDRILSDLQHPNKSCSTKPDPGRGRHRYRIFSFVKADPPGDLFSNGSLSPKDFVIKTELYGIPQARHRVVLLGLREDLISGGGPHLLQPSEYIPSVEDAIGDLPALRSGLSKQKDNGNVWAEVPGNLMRRLKETDPKVMEIWSALKDATPTAQDLSRGKELGVTKSIAAAGPLADWYQDSQLGSYITNHTTRGHIIEDLERYWYAAVFAKHGAYRAPKLDDMPEELLPNHKNIGQKIFTDRFRVQLANKPATTITSHISKDGHYFIHPDPGQMRSFTVREAARIQTFPDNYHFVGSRTEQYVQVGNAVPPLLAHQLAKVVSHVVD
jgi:DNA (cytosine-5)-methyltransferase 1